ncbi:hypothetical protein AVEN_1957-1 [Araneus ventricosus]|uniref:Integrase catalytic domain-containing protein n=1 Tax=Araneus ventricosus TaxID=182803 RepID=A0A4Y2PJ10_ARAVE|nr:hypothetical protein AVEN_1957-1 [Araneus ventricosus]
MSAAVKGVTCPIKGVGTVKMFFKTNGRTEFINLCNVMYSPNLRRNLMAGPIFDEGKAFFIGKNGKIDVFCKEGRKLFTEYKENGLYYCYPSYPDKNRNNEIVDFSISSNDDLEVWHRKYCHVNPHYIFNTSYNDSVRELPNLKSKAVVREPCLLAKSKRRSFKPIGKMRSTKPLELLHLDVCGPLTSNSIQSHRYFLSITDDYSSNVTTFPMKRKTEVFSCFTKYQKGAERFTNSKIVNIRTDNGME